MGNNKFRYIIEINGENHPVKKQVSDYIRKILAENDKLLDLIEKNHIAIPEFPELDLDLVY